MLVIGPSGGGAVRAGETTRGPSGAEYRSDLPYVERIGTDSRVTVASAPGHYMAWPANNGIWSWDGGKEILVGFIN